MNSVGLDGITFSDKLVRVTLKALKEDEEKMSRKKQKTEMEWLSSKKKQLTFEGEDCKGSRLRRHFVDTTQLKFSNLLKEETIFLKKLTNLEKFNFESDFKVNGRRIRDAKVCRYEI